ncbi:MAG: hypothetical protein AAGF89_17030, partial [Bacteroidota bacterium]
MKYLSISLFFLLALTACKEEPKERVLTAEDLVSTAAYVASPDQATSDYTPFYIHKIPAEKDLNAATTPVGGFNGSRIFVPDMMRAEAQV